MFERTGREFMVSIMEMKMVVKALGSVVTNSYLLFDEDSKKAVLFDAPEEAYMIWMKELKERGLTLEAVYLTHGHYDHMLDAHFFAEDGVPVFGHIDDKPMFETPDIQRPYLFAHSELKPVKITRYIEAGEKVDVLGYSAEVRHVPGHCPGNILFYFAELHLALVGDAIFCGSIGRTDLPGGDFATLEKSVREQIYTLPDDVQLLSGHGTATTVETEKKSNPFIKA